MRPKKHEATGEGDLFRARLDQIINLKHELVQLGGKIDWAWIDDEMAPLYSDKGRPGIESRFVIGLLLLKHMFGLSDEGVCERWVYDPYFQHFTGETFFQHSFPHERSDLSHWRKRLGDKLDLLLAESLRVAHASGALRTRDLARIQLADQRRVAADLFEHRVDQHRFSRNAAPQEIGVGRRGWIEKLAKHEHCLGSFVVRPRPCRGSPYWLQNSATVALKQQTSAAPCPPTLPDCTILRPHQAAGVSYFDYFGLSVLYGKPSE